MKNYPFAILLILFFITSASRCKKECQDVWNPKCENYDPCFKKVSADFQMRTLTEALGPRYFEVDTIMKYDAVYFKALDSTDVTYEWTIGTDPRTYTDRVVRIGFDNPTELDIKLTVKRKSGCSLTEGGEQTITRHLVVVEKSAIKGKYLGYLESKPSEKFTIEIVEPNDTLGIVNYYVDNLPNGCKRTPTDRGGASFLINYKEFDMENTIQPVVHVGSWPEINGIGWLDKTHSILTIEYEVYNASLLKTVKEKFIGTKTK